ncbi:MAG: energy-coupling factor ABC transporter permease [Elusimicrobia bacterium]|nr:energy-coupling factor ABC transporter permease [Elusimicrobiota bacterium]
MHIPDGFIDAKTALATAAFSAAGLGMALRQIKRRMPPKQVPLMGMTAAFIFAAQMLNFPVAAGTSGHLTGSVLACVLLGPSAAVIVMSSVLIVQCLLFADGGITALGANVFNMAVIASAGGYGIYAAVRKLFSGVRGRIAATAFAAWCSVVLASVCCAGELAWSKTVPWPAAVTAMAGMHMVIGLGEALISALVIAAIDRTDFLPQEPPVLSAGRSYSEMIVFGLLVSLGLALFVSPFASSWPDGLEKTAAFLGFDHKAIEQPFVPTPFSNYLIPGIGSASAATGLAGAVGAVAVFGLSFLLARFLDKSASRP